MRRVEALDLPEVARAQISGAPPRFVEADPRALIIDDAYQRGLSQRSFRLIERLVREWDWAKFRAPVVVEVEGALHVVDGQHTAIAAATHGGLATIPVGIVEAASLDDRARAFVGLNRDRLNVTPAQIYHAELASGGEDATTLAQVCARAGVTIVKVAPPLGRWRPGETMAIASIRTLIDRRGIMAARAALEVLVKARCAPVSGDLIRAVEALLYAEENRGRFDKADLVIAIRAFGDAVPAAAREIAARAKVPIWRALVIHLQNLGEADGRRSAA